MLNDMKIGTRLIILLALLLVLMGVIGAVGLYASNRASTSLKSMYEDRLEATVQLNTIARKSLRNRLAIANTVISPEYEPEAFKEIEANKEIIDKQMGLYMDADEKVLAGKLKEARARFVEEGIKPALAAMQANNIDDLKKLRAEHILPLYEALRIPLDELIALQEREAKKLADEAAATYKTVRILSIVVMLAATILGLMLGVSIIRGINRSAGELRGTMVRMAADGDLNARAKVYGKDEIGQAAVAFNGLIEGIANIIRQVINGAGMVSGTSAQLSVASLQISQGSQAQSEAAASTAAAVEQITVSINSVAANTEDVRKLSEKSLNQTQQGNQSVTAMIGEIGRVQEAVNQIAGSVKEFVDSTRAIAGMTQQVKDIADQTNLLALNAAIEAARAGEQGRGFAVVADEVRKLAEKSAKSANEIDQVTNSLNQKSTLVEAVVQTGLRSLQATQEQVEHVSVLLTEAGEAVSQSSHGVSDIAASVSEQSLASTEIARNVEKMAQMSEENHAAIQSNNQDITRLEGLAKELQAAVSKFKV